MLACASAAILDTAARPSIRINSTLGILQQPRAAPAHDYTTRSPDTSGAWLRVVASRQYASSFCLAATGDGGHAWIQHESARDPRRYVKLQPGEASHSLLRSHRPRYSPISTLHNCLLQRQQILCFQDVWALLILSAARTAVGPCSTHLSYLTHLVGVLKRKF